MKRDNPTKVKAWDKDGYRLPRRERQVAVLMMRGYTRAEIATKLCISFTTVRNKITLMLTKYHAYNGINLIHQLMQRGLLFVDTGLLDEE